MMILKNYIEILKNDAVTSLEILIIAIAIFNVVYYLQWSSRNAGKIEILILMNSSQPNRLDPNKILP